MSEEICELQRIFMDTVTETGFTRREAWVCLAYLS